MIYDPKSADDQEYFDEIVEIDEDGNVHKHGKKTTILRDPEGEY